MRRRTLLAMAGLLLVAASPAERPPLPESLAAFRVTPAQGDGPESILIPGAHRMMTGILPPHLSVFQGRDGVVLETIEAGNFSLDLVLARQPLDLAAQFSPRQMALLEAALQCTRSAGTPLSRNNAFGLWLLLDRVGTATARDPAACPAFTAARGAPTQLAPRVVDGPNASGGDPWFRAIAQHLGLPLSGLETSAEGMGHWAAIPSPVMLRIVARDVDMILEDPAVIAGLDPETLPARLLQVKLDGDFETVAALFLAILFGEGEDARVAGAYILDARNRVMADRLAPRLRHESLIVTAGAAHFGGRESLPALLRAAGFRVEPIRVPTMVPHNLRVPPSRN
ncbi:TraB/GumN family protein [Roseomonas sp. F4]